MNYDSVKKFYPVLREVAALSKDQSTKVGCVALGPERNVLGVGYNGFPRGVFESYPDRHERPAKYLWTAHAEENLIAQSARHGVALKGATLLLYPLLPCAACARMIVQAGFEAIVVFARSDEDINNPRWNNHFDVSEQIFKEAGVDLVIYVENDTLTMS